MATDPNKAVDDEYHAIEMALESKPVFIRHYNLVPEQDPDDNPLPLTGTNLAGSEFHNLFTDDETGGRLEAEFCNYEIEGTTIALRANHTELLSMLYDADSYYDETGTRVSFAAFALSWFTSPFQKKGEKVLYVDIICTSKESRRDKKRYGELLLKSLETYAADHGYAFVELDAIKPAVGFYEKMGYTAIGEGDDGTVMRKTIPLKKDGGRRLRLKTLRKSHKKEKKWDAVFEKDGKEKVVPFGQKGYSDFTKHKDTKRRQRYIDRHSGMGEDWKDPTTPGALSRYILWNKKTLRASLRDFKKKFHV